MVEGAAPLAGFRTSHGDVAVAVQFNVPDPVFVTLIGCGVGLAEVAPKNVRDDGVTDRIAALTANVTGIVTGAFSAPGAYTVKVPLYAPCANPFGFAVTVIVAGVTIEETEAVSQLALLVTVHAVDAPPAVMFTVFDGGITPGIVVNASEAGEGASSATWFSTLATRIFE